jgi:hypothetical protein
MQDVALYRAVDDGVHERRLCLVVVESALDPGLDLARGGAHGSFVDFAA